MQQQYVICTARGGQDLCGICGRQMVLGQIPTQYFVSDLSIMLPPIFHIHSYIGLGMDTRPVSDGRSFRERDPGSHSNEVQSKVKLK